MFRKIQKWWLFNIANPVIARGKHGGFKYVFRKFWLDIETVSGNFKCRVMASEHPYAYLLTSVQAENETNVFGFAERLYLMQATLTRDQGLVNDIDKAFAKYEKRVVKSATEEDEEQAIAEMQDLQEYIEKTPKEKRKYERDVNGRFKKAVKVAQKL